MSIRIHHGYRVATADPAEFLARVEAAVAPVRDRLDALLYADLVADLVDRRDRGRPTSDGPVLQVALEEFLTFVNEAPGTVLHRPHSVDLDYAYPDGDDTGLLYVLFHVQRGVYTDVFEALAGVEPYGYWTSTDRPEDLTEEQWARRRADWDWLIDAPSIGAVTRRWSYRPDPAPAPHVLDPDVVVAHLPSRGARARRIAEGMLVTARTAHLGDGADLIEQFVRILDDPAVAEAAAEVEPTLRDITAPELARL